MCSYNQLWKWQCAKAVRYVVVDRGRVKTVTYSSHVFDHNICIAVIMNRSPESLLTILCSYHFHKLKLCELRRWYLMYYYIIYNLFSNTIKDTRNLIWNNYFNSIIYDLISIYRRSLILFFMVSIVQEKFFYINVYSNWID